MKRFLPVLLITLCHASVTFLLFLQAFGMGMARFDTGAPSTLLERVISAAATVLMYPLITPILQWRLGWLNSLFPGLFGYIPFVLNSLIWALVLTYLLRRIKGRNSG